MISPIQFLRGPVSSPRLPGEGAYDTRSILSAQPARRAVPERRTRPQRHDVAAMRAKVAGMAAARVLAAHEEFARAWLAIRTDERPSVSGSTDQKSSATSSVLVTPSHRWKD
jgi:hypothetical protein